MIIDSSAIMAILLAEPEADELSRRLLAAPQRRMCAATLLELAIVVDRERNPEAARDLEELMSKAGIELIPFTPAHAERARIAYRRIGKGNHPARLNFGDCIAYATAELAGEPLLFKGDDFSHPEVRAELASAARRD